MGSTVGGGVLIVGLAVRGVVVGPLLGIGVARFIVGLIVIHCA